MYNLVSSVSEVLLVLFQGYSLQWFYGQFMETRYGRWKNSRYLIMILWVVMRLTMSYLWQMDYDDVRIQGKLFVTIGFLVIMTMWLYMASYGMKLYLSITFLAINEISWVLSCIVLELGRWLFSFLSWCLEEGYISSADTFMLLIQISVSALQLIMFVVFAVVLRIGLRSIVRRYCEKDHEIHRTELFFILTPSMVGLMICILLRMLMITVEDKIPYTLYERYPGMLVLVPAILLLSLLSILYGLRLFQDMISLNREKSNRIVLEKSMEQLQEHIGEMERVYTGIRSMRHDVKNQLAVVMQLAGQRTEEAGDELRSYLLEMEKTIDSLEFQFRTGNTVADTILTMKYNEAERIMPELVMETDQLIFPEGLHIHNYDIGIILCNAVDNAIEACARMKAGECRPWIRLSSMERGRMFFLEVENSFDGQIRQKKRSEFPKTGKADKEAHGIGMYNIQKAAEKYQGAVDWDVRDNRFLLTVMMRNEEGGE